MFNFKITNIYYYLFAFFGLVSILILLYFWRKIVSLSATNIILEKKYKELKKQTTKNFDNVDKDDFMKGDNEMQEIFNNIDLNTMDNIAFSINSEIPIAFQTFTTNIEKEDLSANTEIDIVDKIISDTLDDEPEEIVEEINKSILPEDIIVSDIVEVEDVTDIIDNVDSTDSISVVSENTYSKSKLSKLNVEKLKEICVRNGGSDEGTKNVLIDRILSGSYK
jgi:hypothetical protein|uniref:SAP domain-containing protein n=1 Tax=viral metagenome TaxID=1070528 RepID=A0A6C0JP17_9ZZZZ